MIIDAQGFDVRALQTVFAKNLQESLKRDISKHTKEEITSDMGYHSKTLTARMLVRLA